MAMAKSAHASGDVPRTSLWCSNEYNAATCTYSTEEAACAAMGADNPSYNYNLFIVHFSGNEVTGDACYGHPASSPNDNYWAQRLGWLAQGSACPSNSTPASATSCTCNDTYQPDPFHVGCAHVPDAICPVNKLNPLDPAVQPYEDGLIDMINETQATREGAACIVREARARHLSPQITSGYRPPAYQTHIREVYDKWQLLKNNNDSVCADTKRQVENEFNKHSPFSHQPGNTSRHSSGRAVDIHLSDYTDADTIAARCNMSRPVTNDRSHFESPR